MALNEHASFCVQEVGEKMRETLKERKKNRQTDTVNPCYGPSFSLCYLLRCELNVFQQPHKRTF